MTQSNLIEQARHGNVRVLAALMNRLLKPQGMMAEVVSANDCLEILIESDKRSLTDEFRTPNQEALVGMIKKWMNTLGIHSPSRVSISWQRSGQDSPAWTQEFELDLPVKSTTTSDEFSEHKQEEQELISSTLISNPSTQLSPNTEDEDFTVFQTALPRFIPNLEVSNKYNDDATVFQFVDEAYRDRQSLQPPVQVEVEAELVSVDTIGQMEEIRQTELEYIEYLKQAELEDEQAAHSETLSRKSAKAGFMRIFLQYLLVCIAIVATVAGIHYIFAQSQPVKDNTKAVVKTKQVL